MSHTAIIENKGLGHALSIAKAQQNLKRGTKVLTNSEKDGDKKVGRWATQSVGHLFDLCDQAPDALSISR